MSNPTLSDLIGGIQAVTLGDEEARRRGTQKTVLERKAPATFDVLVEIQSWDRVLVYSDVAIAVDGILRGEAPQAELRARDADGQIQVETSSIQMPDEGDGGSYVARRDSGGRERSGGGRSRTRMSSAGAPSPGGGGAAQRIYPFGINRDRLERAIANLRVPATIVRDMNDATMVMTLKNYYRQGSQRVRQAEDRGVPVYVLRNNTVTQIERQLADVFNISAAADEELTPRRRPGGHDKEDDPITDAILEAETAISQVLNGERSAVELAPRGSYVRRLQHQMAERYNLHSESRGREPNRRVKVYR